MFYSFEANKLPHILRTYLASRNNYWTIVEPEHLFIYIIDGECTFELDGTIYHLQKGSAIFIPANTYYFRRPIDNTICTFLYIHFTLDADVNCIDYHDAAALLKEFKNYYNDIFFEKNSNFNEQQLLICNTNTTDDKNGVIEECILSILHYSKNQYIGSHLIISVLLWRTLAVMMQNTIHLLENSSNFQISSDIPNEIKNIVFYIKNHCNNNISIDDLCKYSSLSKQQLIRLFKKHLHTTPMAYILDYKLCLAKALLMTNSSLTIKEVTSEVGFSDPHYFCRIFKKKIGVTPTEYKRSNKQEDIHRHLKPDNAHFYIR